MAFNIAVDGPAGAGKSTIARLAASRLGIVYIDTGAMYRAIALYMLRNKVDIEDEAAVGRALPDVSISVRLSGGEQEVLLNGENVNAYIRTPEVSDVSSRISAVGAVREKLVAEQQKIAKDTDLLMDGRDIGTCVLPDAPLKIYLTASAAVRGQRRLLQMQQKGEDAILSDVIRDIEERDYRDMHREISPLRQADDAVYVDTSDMSIDEVTDYIVNLAAERRRKWK